MVDGPNMYNYCLGDPVNNRDPMGTKVFVAGEEWGTWEPHRRDVLHQLTSAEAKIYRDMVKSDIVFKADSWEDLKSGIRKNSPHLTRLRTPEGAAALRAVAKGTPGNCIPFGAGSGLCKLPPLPAGALPAKMSPRHILGNMNFFKATKSGNSYLTMRRKGGARKIKD